MFFLSLLFSVSRARLKKITRRFQQIKLNLSRFRRSHNISANTHRSRCLLKALALVISVLVLLVDLLECCLIFAASIAALIAAPVTSAWGAACVSRCQSSQAKLPCNPPCYISGDLLGKLSCRLVSPLIDLSIWFTLPMISFNLPNFSSVPL